MREWRSEGESGETAERRVAAGAAGKRTRTERLRSGTSRGDGEPDAAATHAAGDESGSAAAASYEDPFAMHLIGDPAAARERDLERGRGADGPGPVDPDDAANESEPVATPTTTENDAEPAGGAANEKGGEGESEGSDAPVASSAGTSEEVAPDEPGVQPPEPEQAAEADAPAVAPVAMDEANEPAPSPAGDGAAAPEMDLGAVASAQAALIQTRAAEEHLSAVNAIGQREQLLRSTFAQQRAAVTTVAATEVARARTEAKAAAERARGRNGAIGKSISQMIDEEVARLSHATQDAMGRVTVASKAVFPAISAAANDALPNANLDLADANEGQLANELYQRLIPKARTAARNEVIDARARDIDKLASTRDANIRQLRRAGDMLVRQVGAELGPVEQQFIGGGEQLAALINHNAQSQLAAIAAAERDAAAFFARARSQARQLLDAGRKTAAAVRSAAASQAGSPGASARVQSAAAHASEQLASRRERLVSSVDGVADRATATVAQGLTEFQGECGAHRALALGNYAAIEGTLAGTIAGKVGQIRDEWANDVDVAIISANSFAAVVESNRAALAAQLPAKFGGIVRSAFSEARKSRLTRFGEGVWGAVSGLVTTVAKFVAAALIIAFAPLAFGVAALIGKAGALAGIVRDAAMAIVGMAQAFADRFRVLFRTWDDWPWYGKVAGLWATTLVAIGDTIGLPSIFEGVTGRELISNRELSYDERGAKTAGGGFAAMATFAPAKVHADKARGAATRNAAAFQAGREIGELEAQAASRAEATAASKVDDAAVKPADDAAKVRGGGDEAVVLAGEDLAVLTYAERIPPIPGMLDVVLHGSIDDFIVIRGGRQVPVSHRSLAQYVRNSGQSFERIRLISCETGAHTKGVAQHLANQLDVDVYAPTEKIHIRPDGSLVIGPKAHIPRGQWQKFEPSKSSYRYTPAKEPAPTTPRERLQLPETRERLRAWRDKRTTQAAEPSTAQPPGRPNGQAGEGAKTLGADEPFLDDVADVERVRDIEVAGDALDEVPDRRGTGAARESARTDRGAPSDLDDGMHAIDEAEDAARKRQSRAAVQSPTRGTRTPLAEHVPPPGDEFIDWFDSLTLDELDTLLADRGAPGQRGARQVIADNIRHPGQHHEWLMVSHARRVKQWGVSMRKVLDARTRTELAVGRRFRHGGSGSGAMHEALSDMILESKTFWEFRHRLSAWADRELFPIHGPNGEAPLGRYYLPEDLQVPAEGGGPQR